MGTAFAPTNSITDSYIGNPGLGYITSSPRSIRAMMAKNMMGFAPGVTTTCSGLTLIAQSLDTSWAMTSRKLGRPAEGP